MLQILADIDVALGYVFLVVIWYDRRQKLTSRTTTLIDILIGKNILRRRIYADSAFTI